MRQSEECDDSGMLYSGETAKELPLPMDIEDFEREESELLLKVAEERKDFR